MDKSFIMCVDDEPHVLESLTRDLLRKYGTGFEIETCESAAEAMGVRDELQSEGKNIAIYIVDQRMPGMKGIEFLKNIEKNAGKILLTAYADTQVAIEGINHKCIDFYMLKPWGNELFKCIDNLIFAKERGIFVTIARTPEERKNALRVQNTVFSEDHLGLPYEKGINIIGRNPYDETTEMYVAINQREMIGTTSISRKNDEFANRYETILGLPIEEFYDISNIVSTDGNLAQVRNATVLPEFQNRRIAPMIWAEVYRALTKGTNISKYVIILAASEIRDAKTAMAVFEKVKQTNYYNKDIRIELRQKNNDIQDINIGKKDIYEAVIPRLLKMYSKMNFKIIGEPVYYENFKMFDFPMLLEIDELAEPYRTWFEEGKI